MSVSATCRPRLAPVALVAYSAEVRTFLLLLILAACKNSPTSTPPPPSDNPLTRAPTAPADKTPLPGVDLSALNDTQKTTFASLVDSLPSPCGKAHSLRTSLTSDATCKRAPFAAKYVAFLLSQEAREQDVTEMYKGRYKGAPVTMRDKLVLDNAPRVGPIDAKVQIIEWFDYECPSCIAFHKELNEVKKQFGDQIVVYYKMFPLPSHQNSLPAAKAALAAHKQGKFLELHDRLFGDATGHTEAALLEKATNSQLDLARFRKDMDATAAQITADKAEGELIGLKGTPTILFNGRLYDDPRDARVLALWIEEELAVN